MDSYQGNCIILDIVTSREFGWLAQVGVICVTGACIYHVL